MDQNNETSSTIESSVKTEQVSKLAIISLTFGIIGFFIPILVAIPGLILGIVGIRRISRSQGVLKGSGFAIAGTIVSGVSLLLWLIPVTIIAVFPIILKATAPDFEETGGYSICCRVGDGQPVDDAVIDQVCEVLEKRIGLSNCFGLLIDYEGDQIVKISVPVTENSRHSFNDPEALKRILSGMGSLEFRILATLDDNTAEADEYRAALVGQGPKAVAVESFGWFEIQDFENWPDGLGIVGQYDEKNYVLCSMAAKDTLTYSAENPWKIRRAYPSTDGMGRPAIGFTFDEVAANEFFYLTSGNIGKPLCILLDDKALAAPNIQCAIRASGVITGQYTQTEVAEMVSKLNAGRLPAPVRPLEETLEWTVTKSE